MNLVNMFFGQYYIFRISSVGYGQTGARTAPERAENAVSSFTINRLITALLNNKGVSSTEEISHAMRGVFVAQLRFASHFDFFEFK
ncbi:hypothetical protein QMN21_19850 [Serratia sp. Se-PFBMAAmG]|nr:hypothetical protein [Serratia sp. Se-PFBMAAmG]